MSKNIGISVAIIITVIAYLANMFLSSQDFNVGSSTLALILGAIIAYYIPNTEDGGRWMISMVLPISIVLLGFGLNLTTFFVPEIGLVGIAAAFATAITSFIICYFVGKYLELDVETCVALGTGGAICGNSAVVAVSPGLKLKEERVAVILAIINLLGLITFLLLPLLSSVLGLSEQQGGIWAGSVVHAVPQAIAAGETMGQEAMVIATAVKLSRVSLLVIIVPLCALLGNSINKENGENTKIGTIPYFVPGFVIAAILSTWVIPDNITEILAIIGKYLLLPILASVGFFITKESMKDAGGAILLVGIIATVSMLISSYATIIILS
ncbi:MAG: putative sulfate exporter family transporter [Candidatus Thalassarchaeum sp.]|nr:putative sulfate exporter family transporter [Candidatus Thalassarchaeum sp.]MDB3855520.1 putative sulfate exporter family transporter [Euryarchaeota archaeon]